MPAIRVNIRPPVRESLYAVRCSIRTLEPKATLYLLGYYNPFPANPTNPATPLFAQGGPQLNSIIANLANQYGAYYVDTEPAFAGQEASLTYLAQQPAGAVSPGTQYVGIEPIGNVHPNAAGYQAIANKIAAVPEPATWVLVGLTTGVLCLFRVRLNVR